MRKLEPTYAQFHEQSCPVDWTKYGGGSWFVAGYQELRDAARDDVTFSSRHDLEDGSSPFYGVMVPPLPVRGIPIELERRECQSFRRVVSGHFSAAAVDRLLPAITEVVDDAIDARIESGSIDLFHDLAKIVPASILLRILGLTASDVLVIADTVHRRGPDRFTVGDGWDVLRARVCEVLAARRNQPQDDLISTLAGFDGPEGPLDDESIIGACFLFVVAGMSTTAKLALGALGYLGTHPAARRLLTERPDMISPAIEEFLRYYSPVPALSRTAATDTELGGVKISTGDRLTLGYGAANRDPAVFDRPNEVVLDRSPNPHVAMGHGLHYCIGARLGKAEATVMVTRALTRLGDFQVIPGQRHMGKLTVRPVSLKASFTPGPRSKPSGAAPAA
jgi:cytochrome P450